MPLDNVNAGERSVLAPLHLLFGQRYTIVPATTPALVGQALALRYQAYCVENPGFEAPERHPGGKERDEFDLRSRHALLSRKEDGSAVGTVRIVLPKSGSDPDLPVHRVSSHPAFRNPEKLPPESSGEISRFTLPKKNARRGEGFLPRLGLIRGVMLLSAKAGLTHWCAVMDPALLKLLAATGVHFELIGPPMLHHGLRQPCLVSIHKVLDDIRAEHPAIYELVTDQGRLAEAMAKPGQGRSRTGEEVGA